MLTGKVVEIRDDFISFLIDKKEKADELLEQEKEKIASESGPMKLDVDIKHVKKCFGPASVCSNCESRGGSQKYKPECSR